MTETQEQHLVIVGGGLVGGALACALAPLGLRISLLEARAPTQPSADDRYIALALGSQRILAGLGLWEAIAPAAEPIRRVHVSDRGHCAFARIDQAEEGVEALGYVVAARELGQAIGAALARADSIERLSPARLIGHGVEGERVQLDIEDGGRRRRLTTRLLVGADGGESRLRNALGTRVWTRDYHQLAVITTVRASHPQPGTAFERFTSSGPLAFLPLSEGRYSVVWTCRPEESAALLALDEAAFLARLQDHFGQRLGELREPGARSLWPLQLRLACKTVGRRLVIIGNAAHQLHPVAGQGLNLGLRDVAALAEVLSQAPDPGAASTLADYQRWRGRDALETAWLTDTLARLFIPDFAPLVAARALGMLAVDALPPLRRGLARRFMGLQGRAPRLARGLPLENPHA